MTEEEWVDTRWAHERLNLSEERVRQLAARQDITAKKDSHGNWLYRKRDIETYAENPRRPRRPSLLQEALWTLVEEFLTSDPPQVEAALIIVRRLRDMP